jgi:hypothetical protein
MQSVSAEQTSAQTSSAHLLPRHGKMTFLQQIPEEDAPGVTECRREIDRVLSGRNACVLEHEQIVSKFDETAKLFNIVILKSTLTIPYTSVSSDSIAGTGMQTLKIGSGIPLP